MIRTYRAVWYCLFLLVVCGCISCRSAPEANEAALDPAATAAASGANGASAPGSLVYDRAAYIDYLKPKNLSLDEVKVILGGNSNNFTTWNWTELRDKCQFFISATVTLTKVDDSSAQKPSFNDGVVVFGAENAQKYVIEANTAGIINPSGSVSPIPELEILFFPDNTRNVVFMPDKQENFVYKLKANKNDIVTFGTGRYRVDYEGNRKPVLQYTRLKEASVTSVEKAPGRYIINENNVSPGM
jgi:hypothetical protein